MIEDIGTPWEALLHMRILIAEDDVQLASFMKTGLQEDGHTVDMVHDGAQAVLMAQTEIYDVIILDIILPQQTGLEVIRQLRGDTVQTPILCLTARDKTQEKVAALDLGADDYMVKPFEFSELTARLRALERRSPQVAPGKLTCGDLEMDIASHTVSRAGQKIDLTPREYTLLEHLLRHVGSPVSRTSIVEHVWDMNFDSLTNVVDVFVNRVRKKADKGFDKELLRTVRGVGYMLEEPDA